MLGNLTSSQGVAPLGNALDWSIPALPAINFGSFAPSSTTRGAVVTSQGGASTGGGVSPAGATALAPGNASPTTPAPTASGVTSGSLADYFLRFVIVVLGFIFVAIGLNMFKPGIVPNPVRAIK